MIVAMDLTTADLTVAVYGHQRLRRTRPMDPGLVRALIGPGEDESAIAEYLSSSQLPDGGPLGELAGQIQSLVICLPDAWFRPAGGSASARESLTRTIKDGLGLPSPRFLHHGTAVGAALAEPGTWLLAEAGTTVDLTLVAVGAHEIAVLGSWNGRLADGAGPPPAVTAEALRSYLDRAEAVLPQAVKTARYRQTPVYPAGGTSWLTAGALVDWYESVAATIEAGTSALLRNADPEIVRRTSHGGGLRVALGGALRATPLARAAVAAALPPPVRLRDERPVTFPGHVAVDGALEITVQGLGIRESDVVRASLTAHRITDGLLRAQTVPLTVASRPEGMSAYHQGELVTVAVTGGRPARIELETVDVAGGRGRASATSRAEVPTGRFHVGYWPDDGFGTLVLRPESGGRTQLVPLDAAGLPKGRSSGDDQSS